MDSMKEKTYMLTVPSIPNNAQRYIIALQIEHPPNTQVTTTVLALVVADTAPAVA